MTVDDASELLGSWTISMRASRRSPRTIAAYGLGVRLYLRWAAAQGLSTVLDRRSVEAWLASLLDAGAEGATVRLRQAAVRGFSAWLTDDGELPRDALRNLEAVKVDLKVVPSLSDHELTLLLKACDGKTFLHRRDEALVRLMLDTGARAGEVVGMELRDVDLPACLLVVRRGKGGKGRRVPFGPRTALSLDRYLRLRKAHKLADSPEFWLGQTKALTYSGLRDALRARAEAAGVEGFHLHRLRHTAATRWLEAGGTEGGLMALGGWARRDLIDRYTRDSAERRLVEERSRLGLGDL